MIILRTKSFAKVYLPSAYNSNISRANAALGIISPGDQALLDISRKYGVAIGKKRGGLI